MELSLPDATFESYGLDPRLLQALADLEFAKPTTVQAATIPLALRGKDLVARADTGTGKTIAYLLPVIQKVLDDKKSLPGPLVRAVIIVPTRDLCAQVKRVTQALLRHLRKEVSVEAPQTTKLPERPDILVTSPGMLKKLMGANALDMSTCKVLVIDEADLVLSDAAGVAAVREAVAPGCQILMLTATLTQMVHEMKGSLMASPLVIKVQAQEEQRLQVRQYYMKADTLHKHMALVGMFLGGEIKGKVLIFVNGLQAAIKLRIALNTFKIPSLVLASTVPENSRKNIVRQFNEGVVTALIATDESVRLDDLSKRKSELTTKEKQPAEAAAPQDYEPPRKRRRSNMSNWPEEDRRRRLQGRLANLHEKEAAEYGAHRGIDFQHVSWVINFDMCLDAGVYTHRIGRTGRAHEKGVALSFFAPNQTPTLLPYIQEDQRLKGNALDSYPKAAENWGKLRTRVEDVLEAITLNVIDKARVQFLAQEIMNSGKLKRMWKENPEDMKSIRHLAKYTPPSLDGTAYMAELPDYMGLPCKSKDEALRERAKQARELKKAKGKWTVARTPLKKSQANPFSVKSYTKETGVLAKLSDMDLAVLDPQRLSERRLEREKRQQKARQEAEAQWTEREDTRYADRKRKRLGL